MKGSNFLKKNLSQQHMFGNASAIYLGMRILRDDRDPLCSITPTAMKRHDHSIRTN